MHQQTQPKIYTTLLINAKDLNRPKTIKDCLPNFGESEVVVSATMLPVITAYPKPNTQIIHSGPHPSHSIVITMQTCKLKHVGLRLQVNICKRTYTLNVPTQISIVQQ